MKARRAVRRKTALKPVPLGFDGEPIDKLEKLFVQMNLAGQGFGRVGGGTKRRRDPHLVWGGVAAAKLSPAEEALLVYMATGDRKSLKATWQFALVAAQEIAVRKKWIVRKVSVMEAMALTVVYDVCQPQHYWHHSARRWAQELQLADHKDWKARWAERYRDLRYIVAAWANNGIIKLEQQFPGA